MQVLYLNHFIFISDSIHILLSTLVLNRRTNAQLNTTWLHNNLSIPSRHHAILYLCKEQHSQIILLLLVDSNIISQVNLVIEENFLERSFAGMLFGVCNEKNHILIIGHSQTSTDHPISLLYKIFSNKEQGTQKILQR